MLSRPLVTTPLKRSGLAAFISLVLSFAASLSDPNPHGGVGVLVVAVLWLGGLISLAIISLVGLGAMVQGDKGRSWWPLVGVPMGILLGAAVGAYAGDLFWRG